MYITSDEAKSQLSIAATTTVHDDRIARLILAAEAWAANYLNAALSDFEDSPANSPPTIPEDIKSALLLHLEAEFDRDEKQMELLLKRAHELLWPHRVGLEV